MSGSFGDYAESRTLDKWLGATDFTPPANTFIALYTSIPGDASASGTEVTGGSYARVQLTNNTTNWPNASGTNPTIKQNGVAINFTTATADWGTVVAFAIYDALTVGNEIAWGELLTNYTDVVPDSTTDFLNATAHPFANNDAVRVRSTGTIPTGLSASTKYYVVNSATNQFKLSLTQGGAAVDITANGDGRIQVAKDWFKTVNNGDTFSIPINGLQLFLD